MDLRIGDAERDAVTEALHEHFAKGRLTRDELDARLGAALAAKTEGDLRQIVRDLPGPGRSVEVAWSPHHRAALEHRRRHRHGPPPVVPFLFAFFLIGAIASGPAVGMFIAFQSLVLFWLVGGMFWFVHRRRHHRLHGGR
ncbi:DUF1707 SHOCT-like domain-containing protein [Thermomonospora umbrina]|uniref:Uncharacterized protein DUF1707 n=1 Tax=Thermomonospora umbrina TaxID=111806 RepID=A0A3D9SHX7_9ACTN|nr:DUF1707 domain-containing protein [Thermomonospora umbrina]REE95287.1 uncharacterized protein DUF1707 [Thermomonospora umbrina]